MRKFDVKLPIEIIDELKFAKKEIHKQRKKMNPDNLIENHIEKRYLILLISTVSEQSLKYLRKKIVNYKNSSEFLLRYFNTKDGKEPLYPKRDSFDKVLESFGLKCETLTFKRLLMSKKLVFFESSGELEDFEKTINNNRNLAAHNTNPSYTFNWEKITKIFDYILIMLEYYYIQIKDKVLICEQEASIESINKYNEYFVSETCKKMVDAECEESTYCRRKKKNKIKIQFSKEEWEYIFVKYLRMPEDEKIQNRINYFGNDSKIFQLINYISKNSENEDITYQKKMEACTYLSEYVVKHHKLFNYEITIFQDKVYFC